MDLGLMRWTRPQVYLYQNYGLMSSYLVMMVAQTGLIYGKLRA